MEWKRICDKQNKPPLIKLKKKIKLQILIDNVKRILLYNNMKYKGLRDKQNEP